MIKIKFFNFFIKFLEKMINKKIIYYSKNKNNILGKTAVKSSLGFWYTGNILDMSDISYGILNNGVTEKEETNLVIRILNKLIKNKNIIFYDIGANTGYYGIMAGYLGKNKIKCYSFEPIKEYCNCIQESIKLNHLENIVKVFNIAIGNKNGEEKLYLSGSGSSINENFIGRISLPKRKIKISKLDNILQKQKIEKPDFIKIDVEGYEYNVLLGAKKTIKEFLPILFVEIIYSLKNGFVNKDYKNIFNFISNLGYKIFYLDKNRLIEVKDVFKSEGVKMYLCLHLTKHNLLIKDEKII